MNYIAQNEELERAETYLKSLSDYLKETYEERGKYFFVGRPAYLMTAEVGEDILKKAKLPIVSKKQFLEQFFKQYDFELRADFKTLNLTAYDVIIDDKNLEIKLNRELFVQSQKIG